MKRVVLFRNGSNVDGKIVLITHSLEELLCTASKKFNIVASRLFMEKGGELESLDLIRDDDVLYVSAGEPFIKQENFHSGKINKRVRSAVSLNDWVTLNIGGKCFVTCRSTLVLKEPNSMLAKMFDEDKSSCLVPSIKDENGAYLIDRSPCYFKPILNYLRTNEVILDYHINPQGVLEEARYYNMENLISELEHIIKYGTRNRDSIPLTRRDVINALMATTKDSRLRFQGINLAGSDLSRLDLRYINLKFANLHRCRMIGTNLSFCTMERADLSHAVLDGAQLLGVKMACANLEGASLQRCNFEDPACSHASMEGVNLKGANLEGSNMAGVHLRVAALKNANLKHCDLRAAVLAGADLENCDLTGSNLQEANLRGANLKGASLELMQAPVHMSQTVN